MEYITTPRAPTPAGHYSQAVAWGSLVFVSGQLPIDPDTGRVHEGTVDEQAELVIDHVEAILGAAGCSLHHVLKSTLYITDMAHWPAVNAVYARRFGAHRPARAVIPCGPLHHGVLLEMEVVASRPDPGAFID